MKEETRTVSSLVSCKWNVTVFLMYGFPEPYGGYLTYFGNKILDLSGSDL